MSKWFCNSCKSLNASGAKKCYSCGAREGYLGLDGLTGIPAATAKAPTPAGRGPRNLTVIPGGAPDGGMAFADSRRSQPQRPSNPLGRTSRRGVAAMVVSAAVLVAVIGAVAILGVGRGPDPAATGGPGATTLPSAGIPSASPSAAGSPTPSAAPSSAQAGRTPLPTATGTPHPAGSALPADEMAGALVHLVRGPAFSGHVDMQVAYRFSGINGTATGGVDFSGSDLSAHQIIRFPSLDRRDESWLIVSRTRLFVRQGGAWTRVYVQPGMFASNVLDELRSAETLGRPQPASGADRGLWSIHWPSQESKARQLLEVFADSAWTVGNVDVKILVMPDGTPVRVDMEIQASRHVNGQAQSFGVSGSWTYRDVGSDVEIVAPSEGTTPNG